MSLLILIAKVFASFLLVICFIVGILKADPRSHNPAYPPLAEYATGFIMCSLSLLGLYHLWAG